MHVLVSGRGTASLLDYLKNQFSCILRICFCFLSVELHKCLVHVTVQPEKPV